MQSVAHEVVERPLPHSVEAERSILGAVLLDNTVLTVALATVGAQDFFLPQHSHIFKRMIHLHQSGEPIDPVTLMESFSRIHQLEASGGAAYISQLADGLPRVTNVGYYSRIVKEKAVRRELIHSAASMQEEAFAADDDADVILDHAESKLAGVRTRATVSSGLELFDSAEEMENATPLSFAVEGFLQCDAATLIAGLSGQYKTWLALCLMKSMLDESQKLWSTFPVLNKANRVVYLVPESARGPFRYLDDINPIHGVSIPRSKEPEETYAYSLDEVKKILARLDEPGKTVVLTAALTGLRKGEIRGLRWEDFNGKQLNVNRCVWNSIVNEPKTARSRAAVPVMRELADALEGHRERMGKLAAGPIFQAGNGKPLNLDNFARRVIIPAIEKCVRCRKSREDHKPEAHMFELDTSLQWRGWHSFRRGLATNLHAIGVDDKTIQQILRHSNIAMTQNVYIKSLAASGVSAMDLLGAEMRKEAACNNLATNQQQRPN